MRTLYPRPPLSTRELLGVWLGLLGLAEAFVAALFAPNLPVAARAARIAIDLVLAVGFVAYLRGDRAPAMTPGGIVGRTVAVALIGAGGVFALVAPGVDPWRRAFRSSVALALAVAIALGVGRTAPSNWLRRARVLTFGFFLIETIVGLAVTFEVDAPIAVAGLTPAGRAVTRRLEGAGYALPPAVAGALVRIAPATLAQRNGRVVATTRLADTLHVLGDDPVPALARVASDPAARAELFRRADECTVMRVVRPPLDGYRDPSFGAAIAAAVRACRGAKARP
ncbi:MAG TPA: hypothetical protein VGC72_14550 [Candidatus Elarobacter sp.]|jgi:hypothetical protein